MTRKFFLNLGRAFANPIFTPALGFTILIYALEENFFGQPQGAYLLGFGGASEIDFRVRVGATLGAFFLTFAWVAAALRVSRRVRCIYGFLFIAALLYEYGYWKALQRPASVQDLATLTRTSPDLLWTAFKLFFNWQGMIPAGIFVFMLAVLPARPFSSKQWLEPVGAVLVLFIIGTGLHFGDPGGFKFNRGPMPLQMAFTAVESVYTNAGGIKRETVAPIPVPPPQNNIVLLVDESIRAEHLSVNGYNRPTTPTLEALKRQGVLFSWGTAASGATCSFMANALILTGLLPAQETYNRVQSHPTLFQYAKALGYKTVYINAQADHLWNSLGIDDLQYIDEYIPLSSLGDQMKADHLAASQIREMISQERGLLIVLNKKGVHFMYEDSYPLEEAVWLPTPPQQNYIQYPQLAINAYDNGVLYNVDKFFNILLPDLSVLNNTLILYTSDHGQTLFENGATWLHCNYTRGEASVPLIVLGKFSTPPDTTCRSSHKHILPTLFKWMNAPTNFDTSQTSLFTPCGSPENRVYFTGSLQIISFDP